LTQIANKLAYEGNIPMNFWEGAQKIKDKTDLLEAFESLNN